MSLYEIVVSVSKDLNDYELVRSVLTQDQDTRSPAALETLVSAVRHLKFFQVQAPDVQAKLCRVMKYQVVPKDQLICRQGDEGTRFFVILSGSVSIHVLETQLEKDTREKERQRELILERERIAKDEARLKREQELAALKRGVQAKRKSLLTRAGSLGGSAPAADGVDGSAAASAAENAAAAADPATAALIQSSAQAQAIVHQLERERMERELEEERKRREAERARQDLLLAPFRALMADASSGWLRMSDDQRQELERKELERLEKEKMERERELIFGRKESLEPISVRYSLASLSPCIVLSSHDLFFVLSDSHLSRVADVEAKYGPCVLLCTSGHSFGERALIASAPRAATVIAREEAEVMVISKEDYARIFAIPTDEFVKEVTRISHILDKEKRTALDMEFIGEFLPSVSVWTSFAESVRFDKNREHHERRQVFF